MPDTAFSQEWLKHFTDPYAVLGVSIAADERRILKRYRQVAKQLHPDVQASTSEGDSEFANQVLSRLVNPAYQRIKQDKGRNEALATLRFKVRRLLRNEVFNVRGTASKKLLQVPEPEIEIFYEQILNELCVQQYQSPQQFETITRQISELNLVYLRRKMGDTVIREKRTGLVSASAVNAAPTVTPQESASTPSADPNKGYAQRHRQRAQEYIKKGNYSAAIQELKDAVRIEPKNSDFHCLLGQCYDRNNLPGMARVHIKQALRLNPNHAVAKKVAAKLDIGGDGQADTTKSSQSRSTQPAKKARSGLFGGLFSGR